MKRANVSLVKGLERSCAGRVPHTLNISTEPQTNINSKGKLHQPNSRLAFNLCRSTTKLS